jgi:hypothetical protein
MKKIGCTFLLVWYSFICLSQKVQVLNESGYKHDYVVGKLEYIEDPSDTTRLKYIATLRLTGEQTYFLVPLTWFDMIQIKSTYLGADAFLVESYHEDENFVTLDVRLYFAGENFLKKNRLKQESNAVFVFYQTRFKNDTAIFYLDNVKTKFDAKQFYAFECKMNMPYSISTNERNIAATRIMFKKRKPAAFYILPIREETFKLHRNILDPNREVVFINGIPISTGRNSPYTGRKVTYKLKYTPGRMLMDAYK